MLVYRLVKRKRALDLSGIGASLYPGRWNKKGIAVLYTGESKEIALLENIVNLPSNICPELNMLTLEIPDDSITTLKPEDLPQNWYQNPAPTILSEIGQNWISEAKTLALMVPSAVIHSAHNIILNCGHKDYSKVKLLNNEAFYFDLRLKK